MVLYTREDAKAYTVFAETLERILSVRVNDGTADPPYVLSDLNKNSEGGYV